MSDFDDLRKRYAERLDEGLSPQREQPQLTTRQYQDFKAQYLPKHLTRYEQLCNLSEKVLHLAPDAEQSRRLKDAIGVCHLTTTPSGIVSFSILAPIAFVIFITLASFLIPITLGSLLGTGWQGSLFILVFGIFAAVIAIIPLQKLPFFFANNWRMKASNQMVLCVFYIVTYMRHTSNLELAIDFAAEHLAPPLSLDMKKVIWDIETERFDSVKESLDTYLETWKEFNPEFIESIHLIEGSLLESSDIRRVELLDKSLTVMLDETYEKMLHFAHNLKSPLTTLHMLGVILPILGLVILPLMVNFIPEVRWYHMAVVYNIALPGGVYLLAKSILSTRPTGYGNADITDLNPELKKYKDILIPFGGKDVLRLSPKVISAFVCIIILIVGFLPILYHLAVPNSDYVIVRGSVLQTTTDSEAYAEASFFLLDYRPSDARDPSSPRTMGPNGVGAIVLSLLIPLAFGIAFGMYYGARSKNVMKIRERTKLLEQEFASALFQLGNRLGDGLPPEIAFSKVAEVLGNTDTGKFFDIVTNNITRLGMDVERAIFDHEHGAILHYPSNIIESSMKVLVESSKKGPTIASQALINVSEYIKQMHRVDERLKDLMADVISSMKSQVNFLTPVIAGIVIGITSMIASILGTIAQRLQDVASQGDLAGAGGAGAIFEIFGSGGIPTYHFQTIVGLYVVQITFILTIMVNGIENGADNLAEEYSLSQNMLRATLLYVAVSATTIILFSFIASNIQGI